jgi:hypothetical protein
MKIIISVLALFLIISVGEGYAYPIDTSKPYTFHGMKFNPEDHHLVKRNLNENIPINHVTYKKTALKCKHWNQPTISGCMLMLDKLKNKQDARGFKARESCGQCENHRQWDDLFGCAPC